MERITITPRKHINDIIIYDLGLGEYNHWDENIVYKLKYNEFTTIESIALELNSHINDITERIINSNHVHIPGLMSFSEEISHSFLRTPDDFITRLDFCVAKDKKYYLIDVNCDYFIGLAENTIIMQNWYDECIKGDSFFLNKFEESVYKYFSKFYENDIYILNDSNKLVDYNTNNTIIESLKAIKKNVFIINSDNIEIDGFKKIYNYNTNKRIKVLYKITPSWLNYQQNIIMNFSLLKSNHIHIIQPFWTIVKQSKSLLAHLYNLNHRLAIAPSYFYCPLYREIISKPYNEINSNGILYLYKENSKINPDKNSDLYKKRIYQEYKKPRFDNITTILECYVYDNKLILMSFRESKSPLVSNNNSYTVPYIIY